MVDVNAVPAQLALDQALQATGLEALSMPHLAFLNMVGQHLTSMHAWRSLTVGAARLKSHANVAVTDGDWTEASLTLASSAGTPFADYEFVEGHEFQIKSGTGVFTDRWIPVSSASTSSAIILKETVSSAGIDLANADIAGTLHAPQIELPDDFGSLIRIVGEDTFASQFEIVSATRLLELRANSLDEVDSSWPYVGAVIWPGSPSRPVLDVYPEFSQNTESQFTVLYKRGWKRLTSLSQTLEIADYLTGLYFHLCREWALGLQDEDEGTLDERLEKVKRGSIFSAARNMDWRQQPTAGRMSGGQVARTGYRTGPNALATEVAGPS